MVTAGDSRGGHDAVVDRLRAAGCVFAEEEAAVLREAAADDPARLEQMITARCDGAPLEQVVGHADFDGLRIRLRRGVFVPRQRSVRLVARAEQIARHVRGDAPVVVDLGCGSGALLAAFLHRVGDAGWQAYAVERDPVAAACARDNLATSATVVVGAGLDVLPRTLLGRVDLVLANLPYVPSDAIGALPREARLHEPPGTLDGGTDGLDPLRHALPAVERWVRRGGHYLAELHASQVPAAVAVARTSGLTATAEIDPEDRTAVVDVRRPRGYADRRPGPSSGPGEIRR